MHDVTVQALHTALRGLAARQRSIAQNIANIETPGYLAGRVEFESQLKAAMAVGRPGEVQPSAARSLAPTGVNGNNVNLDEETLSNIETGLRYQLAVEAVNSKFGLLRTAVRGA